MKNRKLKIAVVTLLGIGVIVWIIISLLRNQPPVEEHSFSATEINRAMDDLGYEVLVPPYVPSSYELKTILVTHGPPRRSDNPKVLTLKYAQPSIGSYDVVVRKLVRPFANEVDVQAFPTDTRLPVQVNGREAVALRTEIKGSESLRILYEPIPGMMYQVNTENRTDGSLSQSDMIKILESIK